MIPMQELEKAFESAHPDVDVTVEGHGSIQVIRHVTELGDSVDVMAVADHSLIPMMMYGKKLPEAEEYFTDWYIGFATNRLGLAYKSTSKYSGEINEGNWYEVLSRSDVRLGVPDPRIDSCGYRSLILCQIAESYYLQDDIFENVLGTFDPPLEVYRDAGKDVIKVPEIIRADRATVRSSSVVLLGLLDSGDIDYAFEYESVAAQHDLKFLDLPADLDLSSTEEAENYARVRVEMDFQRFATVNPEFQGEPIEYGITIPANCPHMELAVKFIQFLLGPEGERILQQTYQPLLSPLKPDRPENMPAVLREALGF